MHENMWKSVKLYKSIEWWFIRRTNNIWEDGRWKANCPSSEVAYLAQIKYVNENNGPSQENFLWWCLLKTNYNVNKNIVV